MTAPWYERLSEGLSKSRTRLQEQMNVLLRRGPDLDEEFWADLEDILIASDMGATVVAEVVDALRDSATRQALPDAAAVLDRLTQILSAEFPPAEEVLAPVPLTVLAVGVNGTGKTTTVGKMAKFFSESGRSVLLGSGDTFRAAAAEQLDIWAERAGVPVVRAERGTDPASVAFETIQKARESEADLTIIDTAGRLHTSPDLMRELQKIQRVARSQSAAPVRTLLVMDATTGQNGLAQAREFDSALDLDGIVLTKLDGTAKGGVAFAVVKELRIPLVMIGVGEGIDDLRPFDAEQFTRALFSGE